MDIMSTRQESILVARKYSLLVWAQVQLKERPPYICRDGKTLPSPKENSLVKLQCGWLTSVIELLLLMIFALLVGIKPWSNIMEILEEKDGVDTELLVYAMTLVNKVG